MTTKEIMDISKKSLSTLGSLLNKKTESVISVRREGKEWRVLAEVLERRTVPDTQDILGIYEMRFDEAGELTSYKQMMTKRRSEAIEEMEE